MTEANHGHAKHLREQRRKQQKTAVIEKTLKEMNATYDGCKKRKAVTRNDIIPSQQIRAKAVGLLENIICRDPGDTMGRITLMNTSQDEGGEATRKLDDRNSQGGVG